MHFGSLVAAVASYLQAKSNDGDWLLRVEDIDPPREQSGAADLIVEALDRYGFEWDGNPIYQSASHGEHQKALETLVELNLAYRCGCSRSDLASAPRGPLGTIYPGTCRNGCESRETAIRVRTNDVQVGFKDKLQGQFSQRLETESGDFVVRRRDGLIAYHLAVVVDDEMNGVTEVVRGTDLLDSTPRQIWLQQVLGYTTPDYVHVPVITHPNGDKLSKLTGAQGVSLDMKEETLAQALVALGQQPPADLASFSLTEIWSWAIENWRLGKLFGQKSVVKTP